MARRPNKRVRCQVFLISRYTEKERASKSDYQDVSTRSYDRHIWKVEFTSRLPKSPFQYFFSGGCLLRHLRRSRSWVRIRRRIQDKKKVDFIYNLQQD